jgi:hypothetical protein
MHEEAHLHRAGRCDHDLESVNCHRNMARERRRAVICGTGAAGLTLASQLGRNGWEVLVIDPAVHPEAVDLRST